MGLGMKEPDAHTRVYALVLKQCATKLVGWGIYKRIVFGAIWGECVMRPHEVPGEPVVVLQEM